MSFLLSTADMIGIFTGIATILTAGATFLTVKEIKKQRESACLPDICIDTCTVRVYGEISTKNILSSKFKRVNNFSDEFQKDEGNIGKFINVKLHNVGLGAAKKIKFTWSFDYQSANNTIKKLPNYDNGFADFNITYGIGELIVQELSVIPPMDSLLIAVPRISWIHYLYYFSLKYSADDKNNRKYFGEDFPEMPKPELAITYTDIQNKVFTKKFVFSPAISVVIDNSAPENIAIIMVKVNETH